MMLQPRLRLAAVTRATLGCGRPRALSRRTGLRALAGLPLLLTALFGSPVWGTEAPERPGQITESGRGFSITADFPVLPGDGATVDAVNREIRTLVDGLIAPFRADHQEAAAQGEVPGAAWALQISHDAPHQTARYLAVLLTGYDFRGGAHGMPIIEPLVITLNDGRRVPPAGLFRPGADWLSTLAGRCYAELKLRNLTGTDETWLRSGTEPKAENYRLLYPGPTGLKVIFPPYAVAPYAYGSQEVLIPFQDLADILEPTLFGDLGGQ